MANSEEINILRERVRNLEEMFGVLISATKALSSANTNTERAIICGATEELSRVYAERLRRLRGDEGAQR